MNLLHLYYFCKVAELQHYTRAAKELYISQPSLSGAISSLEEELGIALFEKHGRNIKLTKYGKSFYRYVREALRILDEGIAEAKENAGETSGTVEIGCISTIQGSYLPSLMAAFHEKYPNIRLKVYTGQTNEIIENINSGKYDVGFCSNKEGNPNLFFVPILVQPVAAVMNKSHPLAKRESLKLSELCGHSIISYSLSQPIGQQIHKLLKEHKIDGNFDYCTEIIMGGIVDQGLYVDDNHLPIALMLEIPALREFQDIVVVPISDIPKDYRVVSMVFDREQEKIQAVKLFIDFVAAFFSYKLSKN